MLRVLYSVLCAGEKRSLPSRHSLNPGFLGFLYNGTNHANS